MSGCVQRGNSPRRRCIFACSAVILELWAAAPARAQQNNGFQYCDTSSTPWQCTSSTTTTTTTTTYLPDSLGAPGSGALSGQLGLSFSSPAGAALTQLLAPYLTGAAAPQLVSTNTTSTQTVEPPRRYTAQDLVAPVGPERAYDVGVQFMGSVDVTNTHTAVSSEQVYQRQQSLDAAAISFLLGDIYAAVPAAIIDGDTEYLGTLLGHAAGPAQAPAPAGQTPLAFAGPGLVPPPLDAAAIAAGAGQALVAPDWTAWLAGTFGRSGLAASADHLALAFGTVGTALGADYADGPWRAGGSIGFGRTGFEQPAIGDSGAVTSVRAGAYAGFDGGDWSITAGLSGGYHWTQATRLSGLPSPATAAFGAASLSAGFEASRRFSLLGARFEPLAGAMFSLVNTAGFTESGTGTLDLEGKPATLRTLRLFAGARLSGRLALAGELAVEPVAHFGISYDALADPAVVTSSFVGDPGRAQTAISGLQPGRWAVQLGAGAGVAMARAWRLNLAYRLQLRGGSYPAHSLSASVGGTW